MDQYGGETNIEQLELVEQNIYFFCMYNSKKNINALIDSYMYPTAFLS